MSKPTTAPYGHWESPISLDAVAFNSVTVSSPRHAFKSGRSFFAESKKDGKKTFMEIAKNGGVVEVLPDGYSVANRVYEYGASLYDVFPDGRLIFSNKDGSVCLLNPDTKTVKTLVKAGQVLRYASFSTHASSPWALAIEEDHTDDTPAGVKNYIVAIHTETGKVKRVVEGADFYYTPRFSPDGSRVSWLSWNHPDMLFDSCSLYWAMWEDEAGSIGDARLVAGGKESSVAEPQWSPDNTLYYCEETEPYRRMFRLKAGDKEPELVKIPGLEKAELGEIRLAEGSRTYTPLSSRHLLATACFDGLCQLIAVDLETGKWEKLADDKDICHIAGDSVHRIDEFSALVVAAGTASSQRLYRFDIRHPGKFDVIRETSQETFTSELYSPPERLHFKSQETQPSREVHGFLWMPRNPQFVAPQGQLPPLIVSAHGGPTGYTGSGLDVRTQYFTSRGYALLKLNYTGSTGFGKAYRQRLNHVWGIIDADDAAECAKYLSNAGRVKSNGVGITGISAGGYNTLQCLVRHPSVFTSGFCVSGISDLTGFDAKTHKLEMSYTNLLICPADTPAAERDRVYKERSALYHTECIKAPLYLLHATDDMVVPLEQATLMADALKKHGQEVELKIVQDEGHSIGKPPSKKLWLDEEEKWWKRTLLS